MVCCNIAVFVKEVLKNRKENWWRMQTPNCGGSLALQVADINKKGPLYL